MASVKSHERVVNLKCGAPPCGPRGWGRRGSMTVGFLDGLVAGVAPLPANEVGQEHDEHQAGQGRAHDDGDQHVVLVQLTLLGWKKQEATRRGFITLGAKRGQTRFLTRLQHLPALKWSPLRPNGCTCTWKVLMSRVGATMKVCFSRHMYECPTEPCR